MHTISAYKPVDRIQDGEKVGALDENFYYELVKIAGNLEMLKMHQEISERIRIVRRLDFTQQNRTHERMRSTQKSSKQFWIDVALRPNDY